MESSSAKVHALPAYHYQPLSRNAHEIRLVKLMKGSFDDDLEIQIVKTSFSSPTPTKQHPRLTVQELQRTVPTKHRLSVRMNLEGRYVFVSPGVLGAPNTFEHPDPTFDCSLYERSDINVPDQPAYDALSYTWGVLDRIVTAYIMDDMGSRRSRLAIGTNLAIALRYMRMNHEHRNLWIDALCINQEDIQERNHEVKRMGEIYTRASNVVIWLGEAEHDTKKAMSTLKHFAEQVEVLIPFALGDRPGAKHLYWWMPEQELPYDEQTWTAICRLFRSSWFTRTWVLQECQLSDTRAIVQSGYLVIPWPDMRRAMAALRHKYLAPPEILSIIMPFSTGFQAKYCRSLSRLLAWTNTRECTDPRDKVYGILGLASSEFTARITPDYELPLLKLYRNVFFEYLAITGRLDLLSQCILSHRLEAAPSWVPNWSAVAKGPVMDIFSFGFRRHASGNSAAYIRRNDVSLLEVLAIPCGRIRHIEELKQSDSSDEARIRAGMITQTTSTSISFTHQKHDAEFVNMVFTVSAVMLLYEMLTSAADT
jgi:hypothetical protein